jgi:16S rRNA processing protein RimM
MVDSDEGPAGMVCLGVIAGARGLRGEVKIRSFTAEPAAIAAYGPLTDASRRRVLRLSVRECRRDEVIATVDGVTDRNNAEALRGLRLYVARSALPEPEPEEFYFADLIGLAVDLIDGGGAVITAGFGRVRNVLDAGGGPLLDIVRPGGDEHLVPFSRAAVPHVDVVAGRLSVADLPGLFSPGEDDLAPGAANSADDIGDVAAEDRR